MAAVIVTGIYPPEIAAAYPDRAQADRLAAHMLEMMPHLRPSFVEVVPDDNWQVAEAIPARGFTRDLVQAFETTGNGRA